LNQGMGQGIERPDRSSWHGVAAEPCRCRR